MFVCLVLFEKIKDLASDEFLRGTLPDLLRIAFKGSLDERRPAVVSLIQIVNQASEEAAFGAIWEHLRRQLPTRPPAKYIHLDFLSPWDIEAHNLSARQAQRSLYQPLLNVLARNPALPADVLAEIAFYAPRAFCSNYTVRTVLSRQEEWVTTLTGKFFYENGNATLMRILRCENAPIGLVRQIAEGRIIDNPLLIDEAQQHISLTGEVPDGDWLQGITDYWRRRIGAATEERDVYTELSIAGLLPFLESDLHLQQRLFQHTADPSLSTEECVTLAQSSPIFAVRLAATINPSAPAALRHQAAQGSIKSPIQFPGKDQFILPILRRHGAMKDTSSVIAAAQEILLLAGISAFDGADSMANGFSPNWRLLSLFLYLKLRPQMLPNPVEAQSTGEHWLSLFAWAWGIRPSHSTTWNQQERDGLLAFSRDGNRWVRSLAKDKLRHPTLTSDW